MDADTNPTDDENGADVVMPPAGQSQDSGGPETASLPIDFCGATPPAEGDIVKCKVVSVDSDNGSFDVVCVTPMQPAARGIKAAVASYGGQ